MKLTTTSRGFGLIKFDDCYGAPCSIQESSLAEKEAIWFGMDSANPMVMWSDAAKLGVETTATSGWVPYPISDDVLLTTRMHLDRKQVAELLPVLQCFAETGVLAAADASYVPAKVAELGAALAAARGLLADVLAAEFYPFAPQHPLMQRIRIELGLDRPAGLPGMPQQTPSSWTVMTESPPCALFAKPLPKDVA